MLQFLFSPHGGSTILALAASHMCDPHDPPDPSPPQVGWLAEFDALGIGIFEATESGTVGSSKTNIKQVVKTV